MMTGFIFGILIGLNFVLFPCEGKIIPPSKKIMIAAPGSDVTIQWSFDDVIKTGYYRVWSFISSDGKTNEILARIIDDNQPDILAKKISGVDIIKPATLVLQKVDLLHNGTYKFTLSRVQSFVSDVMVFVAVLTNATVNCSSPITVKERSDLTCLCEAKGGNPAASVSWYKNNVQIGDARDDEQTLSLRNVERTEGGTYKCVAAQSNNLSDEVSIEVDVNFVPIMTVCSSPITVDEDESVTCLCQGEGGQPPANVTWYKDGVQHGDTVDEKNILTLSHVDITAAGIYNCVGQRYTLKSEKSIQVIVRPNVRPTVTSFTSEKAVLGKSVTLTCEAEGRPSPSYTLIHNDTDQVSNEKTYKIDEVKYSHIGWYKCTAKNKLGDASIMYRLTVAEPANCSTKDLDSGNVLVWHVVAALLSGFVIGFLFACIMVTVYFRRRYRKKKPSPAQSNPEPQSSNSIYQDLDLNKMNEEENYQSLKAGNSGGQNESN